MSVTIFQRTGDLPLFNPDLELSPPPAVVALYAAVAAADALLIASPEYAHGVSGTIKNTLDWLVGFEPFTYMYVAVFNASPRAHHGDAALRETLRTMSAVIVEPASVSVPLLTDEGIVNDPATSNAIRKALLELYKVKAHGGARVPWLATTAQ